jgi:hypothetical protein
MAVVSPFKGTIMNLKKVARFDSFKGTVLIGFTYFSLKCMGF